MEPISTVSLSGCYIATVNESETITVAKPFCPVGSQTGGPQAQSWGPGSGSSPGFMAAAHTERSSATIHAERSSATAHAERGSATAHAGPSAGAAPIQPGWGRARHAL